MVQALAFRWEALYKSLKSRRLCGYLGCINVFEKYFQNALTSQWASYNFFTDSELKRRLSLYQREELYRPLRSL